MDTILQLCDSSDCKYPTHFQNFLDNCIRTYSENFGPNDYLFAAVYFLILETGFSPIELTGNDSVNFDIRKLRSVTGYTENQIRISKGNKSKCYIYQIPLKLGKHNLSTCELQGVPSADVDTHLIINFLSKDPQSVKSLCLNTERYIKKNETKSKHKYLFKNLDSLSILIKNNISVYIKDLILTNEEEGCSANLLCLPEEIQKKIIYLLKIDPSSIQCLSSTCSYFNSFIIKDTKLWEELCFQEFNGWMLNKVLQETSTSGDMNVFRTAFLKLKIQDLRGKWARKH